MDKLPTHASVHCVLCSAVVMVKVADIVLDDVDSVYRVGCPGCGTVLEKDLTLEIRQVLRNVGVATLEERVACFRTLLEDESDHALWHTMYDVPYRPQDS